MLKTKLSIYTLLMIQTINRQQLGTESECTLHSVLYNDFLWEETWNFACWVHILHHIMSLVFHHCIGPSQVFQTIWDVLMVLKGFTRLSEGLNEDRWMMEKMSSGPAQSYIWSTAAHLLWKVIESSRKPSTLSSALLKPRLSVHSLILKDFN